MMVLDITGIELWDVVVQDTHVPARMFATAMDGWMVWVWVLCYDRQSVGQFVLE
jgi:hypothetical protein